MKTVNSYYLYNIMQIDETNLKFKAFTVGLIRSGTVSMYAMLKKNFKSRHEFMHDQILETLLKYDDKVISLGELQNFIKKRDVWAGIEMDSSFTHLYYLESLIKLFPQSVFIITFRDCYSWVDSVTNWLINKGDWPLSKYFCAIGDLPNVKKEEMEFYLRQNLFKYLDTLVGFWASSYKKILSVVPESRRLIIKTHEISNKTREIADFLSIPHSEIDMSLTHRNFATIKYFILLEADPKRLEEIFEKHCHGLMTEYFPMHDFQSFINDLRLCKKNYSPDQVDV